MIIDYWFPTIIDQRNLVILIRFIYYLTFILLNCQTQPFWRIFTVKVLLRRDSSLVDFYCGTCRKYKQQVSFSLERLAAVQQSDNVTSCSWLETSKIWRIHENSLTADKLWQQGIMGRRYRPSSVSCAEERKRIRVFPSCLLITTTSESVGLLDRSLRLNLKSHREQETGSKEVETGSKDVNSNTKSASRLKTVTQVCLNNQSRQRSETSLC